MFKLKLIQKLFMHGLTQNMAKEFRLSDEKKKEFLEKKNAQILNSFYSIDAE